MQSLSNIYIGGFDQKLPIVVANSQAIQNTFKDLFPLRCIQLKATCS